MLLAVSGAAVFIFLTNRAIHLPLDQQKVLRQDIFVARASFKEPPPNYEAEAEKLLQEQLKLNNVPENQVPEVRKMFLDRIKAGSEVVPPGYMKRWTIDTGVLKSFVQDRPLQLRVRFRTSRMNDGETYPTLWLIGDPDSPNSQRITQILPPESFQEFNIPNLIGPGDGLSLIALMFASPPQNGVDLCSSTPTTGWKSLVNVRSELHARPRDYLCWLTLLTGFGLAAGSLLCSSRGVLLNPPVFDQSVFRWHNQLRDQIAHALSSFIEHSGAPQPTMIGNCRSACFPAAILKVIKLVQAFSPIDSPVPCSIHPVSQLGTAAASSNRFLNGRNLRRPRHHLLHPPRTRRGAGDILITRL